MTLSDPELEYYARHIVLPQVGGVGQRKLKGAKVAVIGAGGIGSAVIPALAGAGVGSLTVIDCDQVELANLHRQTIFRHGDIGKPKAALAADAARSINPNIQAQAVEVRVEPGNAQPLLEGIHLVIDGSDNFATRLSVSDACVALGTTLVSAAAMQFQGQVGLFRSKPCYRCFVGDAFDAEDCDTCAEAGVLGALTATVGSFAALMAVNCIVGLGPQRLGRVHLFDGERLEWRTIAIPPDSNCSACGGGQPV